MDWLLVNSYNVTNLLITIILLVCLNNLRCAWIERRFSCNQVLSVHNFYSDLSVIALIIEIIIIVAWFWSRHLIVARWRWELFFLHVETHGWPCSLRQNVLVLRKECWAAHQEVDSQKAEQNVEWDTWWLSGDCICGRSDYSKLRAIGLDRVHGCHANGWKERIGASHNNCQDCRANADTIAIDHGDECEVELGAEHDDLDRLAGLVVPPVERVHSPGLSKEAHDGTLVLLSGRDVFGSNELLVFLVFIISLRSLDGTLVSVKEMHDC